LSGQGGAASEAILVLEGGWIGSEAHRPKIGIDFWRARCI